MALAVLMMLLPAAAAAPGSEEAPEASWRWPVDAAREVAEPFVAPVHDYGPGHRGVDIVAGAGAIVRAPAYGIVAFRGVVVDRPLITLDHGGGIVSTFEPVASDLAPGTVVQAGDEIGTVVTGGHSAAGHLHIGVRMNGSYINPMLMFGDVPRAILLPCCEAITRGGGPVGRSL
ncbi:murein hydrolase activator EnvC family protein [Microbacterium sp. A196]|uniref:murein hydrolase activator EnvC family protein n=1 Tax=Microbacterium sp. A196 TaxID=3457320 RepID=UPI003FD42334